MKRKPSKFGFSDIFLCVILGVLILVCLGWIFKNQFTKGKTLDINVPMNVREEIVSLNGIKNSAYNVKCAHQKELVDGHDYLIFYPEHLNRIGHNMRNGSFVHDPECEKCKGFKNEKK